MVFSYLRQDIIEDMTEQEEVLKSQEAESYSADSIQVLEGLEAVRKSPAVLFLNHLLVIFKRLH